LICAWTAAVAFAALVPSSSSAAGDPIAGSGPASIAGLILLLPLLATTSAAGIKTSASSGFPAGWGALAVAASLPFVLIGAREPGAASAAAAILLCIILLTESEYGIKGMALAGLLLAASSLRSPRALLLLPFFSIVLALSRRLRHAFLFAAVTSAAVAGGVGLGLIDLNLGSWAGADGVFAAWGEWSRILHTSPALLALAGFSPLVLVALSGSPPGRPSGSRIPVILLAGTIALSLALLPTVARSDSAPVFYLLAYAATAALACRGALTLEIIVGAKGNLYWKTVVAALLVAPGLVTFSWY